MENKKSRKEKASETKKKIFETATMLINTKGYDQVTVSEICKAAGLAKGSFYVHYSSKEDIVRESYYSDMGAYVTTRYQSFLHEQPQSSAVERMAFFLNLELEFANYAGYTLTCLAYSMNLGACVPGTSEHFAKRAFTKLLYQEIEASQPLVMVNFSCDEIFNYLESLVRGLMATWCFSNQTFDIVEQGGKYIARALYSIYGAAGPV